MRVTFAVICLLFLLSGISGQKSPIKRVVTLMMENRSFDHLLGYLKKVNPNIDGLNGDESNPIDPTNPNSPTVTVSFNAPPELYVNPGHSVPQTTIELWGSNTRVDPATMNGFIAEMIQSGFTQQEAVLVMQGFNTTSLTVLSTLALEYGLFDHWYASVPGPTGPNRMYALSATSHGATENDAEKEAEGYPQRTFMDDLYDSNKSFKIYYSDFPVCLELSSLREYPTHFHDLDTFYSDCASGNLPEFSWIEPRWFDFLEWYENTQHPGFIEFVRTGNILYGEYLIKQVYEAIRASPNWNETALLIYYDEHGGLHDHVPPPQNNVPNPDGINGNNPPFDFTRLGVRVPAVIVSPWVPKGTLIHEPPVNHFDHTSYLGTVRKILGLSQPPLTKREAWAATFENIFTTLDSPRTDCLEELPIPVGTESQYEHFDRFEHTKETDELIEALKKMEPNYLMNSPPLNDLQQEIINVASGLVPPKRDVKQISRVHDGAEFVREQIKAFLHKK